MEPAAFNQFRDLERTHWWFVARKRIFEHVVRHLVRRSPHEYQRGLDLGCGMGSMLDELGRHGEALGSDYEGDALKHCGERGFARLFRADGQCLPLADDQLDLVTAFDTIEHIEDDALALREIRRVLRPGGRVFVSVPAYQWLYTDQDRIVHHYRRYTATMLSARFRDAGFEVVKVGYINLFLFPLILPVVLLIKGLQRLFPAPLEERKTNVALGLPTFLNTLLAEVFASERFFATACSVPLGHSLIGIARKPLDEEPSGESAACA